MNPRQKTKFQQLLDKVSEAWKPPENITTVEWVKRYMRMPSTKAQGGKVNLDDNPVIPLVVMLYDNVKYELIYVTASARSGKSFSTMAYVGQEMTTGSRRQILEGWPNDNMIRKYIHGDFRDMTRATDIFKEILPDEYEDKKAGSYKQKRYKNGANLISANMQSSNDMSGVDAGIVIVHEWDRIPSTTGNDGSTGGQIMARTQAQWRPKVIFESTPTVENGPIHTGYLLGTQHEPHFYFPCCETWQTIWFEDKNEKGDKAGVTWLTNDKDEIQPETARFVCKGCGELHDDAQIKEIIHRKGEFGVKLVPRFPDRKIASVHAGWLLFTPFGNLETIVAKYATAVKEGPASLAAFYNLVTGMPYSIPGTKIDAGELIGRISNKITKRVVPKGCVMVTAGVDVNLNFLSVQIVAWGPDERKYILYYDYIHGNTSTEEPWNKLFTLLDQELETEYSGNGYKVTMPIEAVCVDTGGADTMYYYTRLRGKRPKYIAIKGSSNFYAPLYKKARFLDISYGDQKPILKGIELNEVGSSQAKVYLFGQLATATTENDKGYTTFGDFLPPQYFKELTSEKLVSELNEKTGKQTYHFDKITNRNEALDTFVYAFIAYRMTVGMDDEFLDYRLRLSMLENQTRLDQTKVEDSSYGKKPEAPKPKKDERILCKIIKSKLFVVSEKKHMQAGDVVDLPMKDYIVYAKQNAVAPLDSSAEEQKVIIAHKAQEAIDEELAKRAQEEAHRLYQQPQSFFV